MELVRCNLCGSLESSLRYQLPDYLLRRTNIASQLVQCCRCGLIYQNPRPTPAEMAAHYPPEYDLYAPEPDRAQTSWWMRLAYQYGMRKRRGFVTRYQRNGRLLDVGCATGLFLRTMQKAQGWEVLGVEFSPHAAAIARERYGLDVRTGTVEQAAFPSQTFDVITLWDVLEHLHDPALTLREIHRLLKPNGLLVLRVPNADSWDARLFGKYWAGLEPPRHLFVFNASTLGPLLGRSNFVQVRYSSGSAAYTTFLLSLKFYLSERGGVLAQSLFPLLYHPLLRVLSAPVFFLASIGLRGPQLVAVAKKAAGDG